MSKLFILAGTKGGIGKTLSATFLADTAADEGYTVCLFDCDDENQSLFSIYGKREDIRITKVEAEKKEIMDSPLDVVGNQICELEEVAQREHVDNAYIVDMKAGTSFSTLDWLKDFPFDDVLAWKIEIFIVGCITSDSDSVSTFSRWTKKFFERAEAGEIRFLIVKNTLNGEHFKTYDTVSRSLLEEDLKTSEVVYLPFLNEAVLQLLKSKGASFGQVANEQITIPEIGRMEKVRIANRYREVKTQLERMFRKPSGKVSSDA